MDVEERLQQRIDAFKLHWFKTQKVYDRYYIITKTLGELHNPLKNIFSFVKSCGLDLDTHPKIRDLICDLIDPKNWASAPSFQHKYSDIIGWVINQCKHQGMQQTVWLLYDGATLEHQRKLISFLPNDLQSAARLTL